MKAIDAVSGFRWTIVLFALAGASVLAQQATAPAAILTVSGVVTTDTDTPLPRVRVVVGGAPVTESLVLTDSRGQFSVHVPDRSARLTFTKTGYVAASADIPRNAANGELRVRLERGGAISGRIVDADGVPMMLAAVTARRVDTTAVSPELSTITNDLGEYRFGGLAEGTYAVAVGAPSDLVRGMPRSPEALAAAVVQGPRVNVRSGGESSNVDFTVHVPPQRSMTAAPRPRTDPPTTGSVSGRVVGRDGRPLAGVQVLAMNSITNSGLPGTTGVDGRYRIDGLAPGDYLVHASKRGFVIRQYGQDFSESAPRWVSLRAGQTAEAIDMALVRGGAISGTIVDEFGEPVEGVMVNVLRIALNAGRLRASAARLVSGATESSRAIQIRTDDRGRYRAFGLQPDTYVVQIVASTPAASARGVLPVYYPGTSSVDEATKITLASDVDAPAIDLTFKPEAGYRVVGVITESNGAPAQAGVLLVPANRPGTIEMDSVVRTGPGGSFAFTNVAPGDYTVQTARGGAEPDQFASALVTVSNSDPPHVGLTLTRGTTLTGRVTYEGAIERSSQGVTLTARPADPDRGPRASSTGFDEERDGTFEFRGLFGLNHLHASFPRPDWYLKSIIVNGQDVTDAPYDFGLGRTISGAEIVVSSRAATATGRVTDERQAPVQDYLVVVFPTSRDRWTSGSRWVKTARPMQDGTYRIPGLPPGDYWIAASDRVDGNVAGRNALPDPAVLETLSFRATRISLNEGQTQDVSLRLIRR